MPVHKTCFGFVEALERVLGGPSWGMGDMFEIRARRFRTLLTHLHTYSIHIPYILLTYSTYISYTYSTYISYTYSTRNPSYSIHTPHIFHSYSIHTAYICQAYSLHSPISYIRHVYSTPRTLSEAGDSQSCWQSLGGPCGTPAAHLSMPFGPFWAPGLI